MADEGLWLVLSHTELTFLTLTLVCVPMADEGMEAVPGLTRCLSTSALDDVQRTQ